MSDVSLLVKETERFVYKLVPPTDDELVLHAACLELDAGWSASKATSIAERAIRAIAGEER
jgi:hypothetical protein